MKSRNSTWLAAIGFIAAIVASVPVAAQQDLATIPAHPRYKLVDLGTFGGPQSFYFSEPVVKSVNNSGSVVGGADTPAADPFQDFCFADCNVLHAFAWHDGILKDLGTFKAGFSSTAYWINERGSIMGGAENGIIDPVFGGPQQDSVIWINGRIIDQGNLGGGFSAGNSMNDQDQVVGVSLNAIPDDFSMLGFPTETRAFLWDRGTMTDLGTLGGPDAWGASINQLGQIVGWSYTNSIPSAVTGIPTQHAFLWERGKMTDLQTLGGTLAVTGSLAASGGGGINNFGQIVGTSNLKGDQSWHAFLSNPGLFGIRGAPKDLGTLGGNNSEAYWINDTGEIVGRADLAGSKVHHAVLWKNGVIKDLGASPSWPCSTAIDINVVGQIIIDTGICGVGGGPGQLWENGTLYDLNTLVQPNSGFQVGDVNYINYRGEIAATGILPDGNQHAILLLPCSGNDDGCEASDTRKTGGGTPQIERGPSTHQPRMSGYRVHK